MASQPLSAADRASLATERGPVNMAVGAALVFEGGPGLSYEAVRERLAARLHLIPRYRQKLVEAPLGVAGPVWADDEEFDLGWHLDHATLPSRLLRASPTDPLNPANQGLTVGILSYDGTVSFGLLADRDLAPPVSEAAAALDASLAELLG